MRRSPTQSITFTQRQKEWLKSEADRLGITLSDLVRRIVDTHMEEKK